MDAMQNQEEFILYSEREEEDYSIGACYKRLFVGASKGEGLA
jgi:hypothetical protein